MDVRINGQRVALAAKHTLGDGGEATVVRYREAAVKIYHSPTPARARKLETILGAAGALPECVVAPTALVHDISGREVIGFTMRALGPDHEPLASLARRSHRASSGVGTREVAALFLRAHDALTAIHRAGAVVGDLNDMNEMFAGESLAWIDVDSFQIGGFPCEVATEAFLDPDLYGPDLGAPIAIPGGKPRAFRPENDWYAFTTLLFRSLTLVHPYGGVDPDLGTLPRRAAARRSVFSPSVRYPAKVGYALEILGEDLARVMREVFDQGARGVFPRSVIADYTGSLVDCASCKAAYPAQSHRCPACAARAPAVIVSSSLECAARDLFEARGHILALYAVGPILRAIALEEGRLVLHTVTPRGNERMDLGAASAGVEVELGLTVAVVAHRGRSELFIYGLRADAGLVKAGAEPFHAPIVTSTERFGAGRAAFACSSGHVYRVARGTLLACAVDAGGSMEEQPMTTVMPDQTWIAAAKSAVVGRGDVLFVCSRALRERRSALLIGRRRVDLDLPAIEPGESILSEDVLFADQAVAYLRRTRIGGVDRVRTVAVDHDGRVIGAYVATAADRLAGAVIRGGAFAGRSLLFPTDRGLTRERIGDPGDPAPREQKLFAATEPFCASDSLLAPFQDGLAVAHGQKVRLLTMR